MVKTELEKRCKVISNLFVMLEHTDSRLDKEALINEFRAKFPKLESDLNFCFEVLAGKHKVGYTYILTNTPCTVTDLDSFNCSISNFYNSVLKTVSPTDTGIITATLLTPVAIRPFIYHLVNRKFRLGYSNKETMITSYSPMLAKKYQDTFREQYYYIQEKLDGNRCIAYYDYNEGRYKFMSRSGKELKVNFNMDWVEKWVSEDDYGERDYPTFDGEVMTLEHAGSRDFNRTSGAINGKYTDKSGLHYFIYDIVAPKLKYEQRKQILDSITYTGPDCQILPVLDKIWVWPNHDYNCALDVWLDKITDKGGEGIMLRDPDGYYQCGKRSDGLLKYKKTQTMDLRIIDFNFGNGKYEGAIGSFVCETDDHSILVNVSGMPDDIHYSDPALWMGKIIEVAYFDISVNSVTKQKSLRFPRLKRVRNDKNTTSIY